MTLSEILCLCTIKGWRLFWAASWPGHLAPMSAQKLGGGISRHALSLCPRLHAGQLVHHLHKRGQEAELVFAGKSNSRLQES